MKSDMLARAECPRANRGLVVQDQQHSKTSELSNPFVSGQFLGSSIGELYPGTHSHAACSPEHLLIVLDIYLLLVGTYNSDRHYLSNASTAAYGNGPGSGVEQPHYAPFHSQHHRRRNRIWTVPNGRILHQQLIAHDTGSK